MNERIRELVALVLEAEPKHRSYGRIEFGINLAELIVRECMKVVINGKYSATECERNTHRIAHNNARDEASSDIKKHFGVEE